MKIFNRRSLTIKCSFERVIDLFIGLYSFSTVALSARSNTSWISDIVTICLIALLGIYFGSKRVGFKLDIYTVSTLAFVAYTFASCLWADDFSRALSKCITILMLFVMTTMIYLYIQKRNDTMRVIQHIIIGIMFVPIFTFLQYGMGGFLSLLSTGIRVGADINNVNVLGQYCAVSALGCVYFLTKSRKPYLWVLLTLSVIACLGTGSRQAILYLICGFFIFYGIRMKPQNFIKTIVIFVIVGVALFFIVEKVPYFEFIRTRLGNMFNFFSGSGVTDRSMTGRASMIERGLESFYNHPFFGIGINNTTYLISDFKNSYYLHNNFVEILASLGLVGFALYYLRHVYTGVSLFHFARKNLDVALIFSVYFASTVMDYGSVTYYSKISWLLLAVEMALAVNLKSGKGNTL